jgi:two-component system cell cycle sensor histidine kinase/response regulator CckA
VDAGDRGEARFRSLFEHARDAILLADDEGRYLEVNPAACRLTGYERGELVGETIELIAWSGGDRPWTELWGEFIERGELRGDFAVRRKDGARVETEFNAVARVLPGVHLSILRDVTGRRRLEERLRQAQKLEAVGQLAAGVAHHFSNLLQAINGNIELARTEVPRESRTLLDDALSQGLRARQLVRQLLLFARQGQSLRQEPVDLAQLLVGAVRACEMEREVSLGLPDEALWVSADRGQLEQVFVHLLRNARDAVAEASPERPRIRLRAERLGAVGVGEEGAESGVLVEVEDNGAGMSEEVRERIFEPFFSTRAARGATGLGLSVAFSIVCQHGGRIRCRSEPGEGSTFSVLLPLAGPAQSPEG